MPWPSCDSFSLSRTYNVAKLTSEISSSLRVITGRGRVSCDGTFAVGEVVADAPLPIANDSPILPILLNSLGVMVSTRLVPSASGFLGQASADAQAGPPMSGAHRI